MATEFADPVLLDKIDKLFECGVGDYIDLPQLVVVGNQSSGKSSVLEGLTHLPFPRDSGLCTRFATQITFRRSQLPSVSASIIPAKDTDPGRAAALKGWCKDNITALSMENFAKIMQEVHQVVGIGTGESAGSRRTFCKDVLKLEICGPEQEHFSVVDVPGIFKKTTEGVTSMADMKLVDRMVRRYMENPRSILLTVIPANVDVATQEILTMAEEVDRDGLRTLGVLTKPDLVDKGAEKSVLNLIEGKSHKLTLGWCLLKNPSQMQLISGVDRDEIEREFFQSTLPWKSVPSDRVGVGSPRVRLGEILTSSIRREFPKVKLEISKRLTVARQAFNLLGDQRGETHEQRRYLSGISIRFQQIAADALRADYGGSNWYDEHPSLRFATAVVIRSDLLNYILDNYGGLYQFIEPGNEARESNSVGQEEESEEQTSDDDEDDEDDEDEEEEQVVEEEEPQEAVEHINLRTTGDHLDLDENLFYRGTIKIVKNQKILDWLTTVYENSRGFELGTFDSSLLSTGMKHQSANWEAIALGYISDVISMAHTFIVDLLKLLCPHETRVRDSILAALSEKLEAKYHAAVSQVHLLLSIVRHGTPSTKNHYFNDNLERSRQIRMRVAAETRAIDDDEHGMVVRLDDLVQIHSMSNVEHVVREIHDILHSYYKVARKRFVDNLCMMAADYGLVTGPDTPLKLFNPSFVNELSDEQLEEIAGENPSSKEKRRALHTEITKLQMGKKILL